MFADFDLSQWKTLNLNTFHLFLKPSNPFLPFFKEKKGRNLINMVKYRCK